MRGSIWPHVRIRASSLSMGEGSYLNQGCFIDNEGARVSIGRNVAVGFNVSILTTTHDISRPEKRAGTTAACEVVIGDGVWIGANAVVLPGACIGKGCVIGAGAVVRGKLEPNSLYAGVPAKFVRKL